MAMYTLANAKTYATLTRTFISGRKYTEEQVGDLVKASAPHGGPLFVKVEEAKVEAKEEVVLSDNLVVPAEEPMKEEPVKEEVKEVPVPVEPKEPGSESGRKSVIINKKTGSPKPQKAQAKDVDAGGSDDVVTI